MDTQRIIRNFLIAEDPKADEKLRLEIARHTGDVRDLAEAFDHSVKTALTVASIPFTMANASVISKRFQQLITAERIRNLKVQSDPDKELEDRAYSIAKEKLDEELKSRVAEFSNLVLQELDDALSNLQFQQAASELLLETVVMIWGAFENLISELVRHLLNSNPKFAIAVISHESAKRYFPKTVSLEALAEHNFSLSDSMGDYLSLSRNVDALPLMRSVFQAIFPASEPLHRLAGDSEMWKLWQRRHLIVHRRGIVDFHYVQKSGDNVAVGQKLVIESDYIETATQMIRQLAVCILTETRLLVQQNDSIKSNNAPVQGSGN